MTLVNARAAFEKAVTDAVVAADATVSMVYDNVRFTTPGKTKKYVSMSITFNQSRSGGARLCKESLGKPVIAIDVLRSRGQLSTTPRHKARTAQ